MKYGWRTLDFSAFEGKLHYVRGGIAIQSDSNGTTATIPLAEINTILIGTKTRLSGAIIAKAAEYDIAILVTDWRNIPLASLVPCHEHSRICARQVGQANLSKPKQKAAWAQIIRAKVRGQANTLFPYNKKSSEKIFQLIKEIRSGDPTNVEAQAARTYWSSLHLEESFSRIPGAGTGLNACLDYAYMILRGHGIRAISSAGLAGTLGIHHHGRGNNFALVDDLIEPFRPAVDSYLFGKLQSFDLNERENKQLIVSIFQESFLSSGVTIPTALEDFAQQYGLYVEEKIQTLSPPEWSIRNGKKR